ncbi:MAG: DUF1566 domain-containing protein [Desulfobulbaceae bacterium]|nr:DUF1566 domain-containing protein [Desulfobulbaceae bacterium]
MKRWRNGLFSFFLTCFFSLLITLNCTAIASEQNADSRFVDQGNEIILDTQTDLMWALRDNGKDIAWEEAKSYCEQYNAGGYSDWRLPTLEELSTIFDPTSEKKFKTYGPITLTACCPWTSNTRRDRAKTLFFIMGEPNTLKMTSSDYMRALPVRNAR